MTSFPRKREPSVFRETTLGPRFRGDDNEMDWRNQWPE
jgi:hypothetical protein